MKHVALKRETLSIVVFRLLALCNVPLCQKVKELVLFFFVETKAGRVGRPALGNNRDLHDQIKNLLAEI